MATKKALTEEEKTLKRITDRLIGLTLGEAADELAKLRDDKREATKVVDAIDKEIALAQEMMFEKLDAQKSRKAEGLKASVSITDSIVANVTDWEALHEYIRKTKNFQLLQKRVSDPAWRELGGLSKGKGIPGTEAFTRRTLNVRSITPKA